MRRLPIAALHLAWLAALTLSAAAGPAQATPPAGSCVAPGGGDDTAALQAELDRCSGARHACSVRLCAGVFHTGILRVRGFHGTLRGAGPDATILRALPDLPVNPRPGFFRDDPFSPDSDPWPYLLQFVEGRATIRDLGILIPDPPDPSRPTTGWSLLEGFDPAFELRGAILLSGREPVDFELTHVRVEAERDNLSELETTAIGGVEFSGLLFDPRGPGPFPVVPARGRFRLTDSELVGMASGTPLSELADATAVVAHNRYRSGIAVDLIDLDRSHVAILENRWHVSYRGVQVLQNLDGRPSESSTILVDHDRGSLSPFLAGIGDGIFFQDPIDASPVPGHTALWVTRNRFRLRNGEGPAASGMTVKGAAGLQLVDNRVSGEAGIGLDVDVTRGCLVLGNSLAALETAGGPDLHLGSATRACLAVVGPEDVVHDEGSGNRVIHR